MCSTKKYEGGFLRVIILDQREMVFGHQLPVFVEINKGGIRPGQTLVEFALCLGKIRLYFLLNNYAIDI